MNGLQTVMTIGAILTLFGTMVLLAAVPGVSVMTVVASTAAGGCRQGVWTTLGIVAGDTVVILIALVGASSLVYALG
ncbi:MAG: hypothetical protein KDI27_06455 [Gammaproteobacteria bacterium]|nr:hypothetical protein [Gammaproteobacteria bacterium]MCB1850104.1 hypothetical protein [Gammaproteobacteria bacterium]